MMRKLAAAFVIGLLAAAGGFGTGVQTASAVASQAKVVIVVGATQSATSSYISDADNYANDFYKYTSNVVKVYSPNATWANVQAAAQGASVLVYLGHGSGYPNPYNSYQVSGDNGMGLNYPAGSGLQSNSYTDYYGAGYMAQLGLATNAIVMLNHLCYASGNSEPGYGLPPLSTAQTRVEGYAAGFLAGNARAVIAEGLWDLGPYIDALFTAHESVDQMWRTYPYNHNNFMAWSSSQSAGYTAEIDPDYAHPQPDGDYYYRSMVYLPGLTTDDIGAVPPPKVYDPTTFHAVTPVRLLDTRVGNGLAKRLVSHTPATFYVTSANRPTVTGSTPNPIPAAATAVTGNLTVTGSSYSWAVYLGPDPIAYPATSTINFNAGETLANGVTVALGTDGSLSATYLSNSGMTTDLVFDVTGYFTPDKTGATYHPLTPARLLDTRSGNGLSGNLAANTPATFYVTSANRPTITGSTSNPVPANAIAVTGNLTVTGSTFAWAVYLGPDPVASPAASTLNFTAGQTRANNLTVALGSGGSLSATYMSNPGNTTDLVFDVTGYYTADTTGSMYVPLTPARLLDTRVANGLSGKLLANTPASFQVTGRAGVPATATGVTGNVTVVNETFAWAVYVGNVANASPSTSTLNFNRGDVRANGVTVSLGSGGVLWLTYMSTPGNTTDLVFDATGYFIPAG
jgi:hypothetical protein